MSEPTQTCVHCGVEVTTVNYLLGERLMHDPYPHHFGGEYWHCKGTVAELEERKPPRPYWLPEAVWLGKKTHEWVTECFGDNEWAARHWASKGDDQSGNRRVIWRVEVPADVEIFRVRPVPATTQIERVQA